MNKKLILILLGLILGFAILIGGGKSATAQDDDPMAFPVDQIIIKYKNDADFDQATQAQAESQLQRLNQAAGGGNRIDYFRPMSGDAHVMRLAEPLSTDEAVLMTARLTSLPEVEYAEPDYKAFSLEGPSEVPLVAPNDTRYSELWHYFAPTVGNYGVNAPAAWDITKGSSGIYVAVLDTGITDHADLAGRWIGGYDLVSNSVVANDGDERDSDPHDPGDWISSADQTLTVFKNCPVNDSSWHGTHVAGTIGAIANNNLGIAGLNWNSKIVPVRVLGKCFGYTSDIADGIRWAAGLPTPDTSTNLHPTKVINMSLGGYSPTGCSQTYQNAIDAAYGAGSIIIVSAGNDGINASLFQPANCNNVLTVAATNRFGNRASYSNYGADVGISGPGGDGAGGVLSTMNAGLQGPGADTYAFYSGTSMAAPHVSGVASLMVSLNPSLDPQQIQTALQSSVTPFPGGSTCNTLICGTGIVNAAAALAAVPDAKPSIPTLSAINNPAGSGDFTVDWNDIANATAYTLQEDDNANFYSPTTAYQGAASQKDFTGKPSGNWYYRVRAENIYGTSDWSNVKFTGVKPGPPVLDTISNPGNEDAYLISWSASSGADGYLLQEAITNTFSSATTRYMGADTQYQVTGQAGGDWYYRVRAYNLGGDSSWSNTENITVTVSALAAPNMSAILNPDQERNFTVDWSDVSGATSYILEESDNPYFVDPVVVYTGSASEKQLNDHFGGTWYYRARALNSTDQGPWSNSQSTTVNYTLFLPFVMNGSSSGLPSPTCTPDTTGDSDNIHDAKLVCVGQVVTGQVSDADLDDVFRIYVVSGQMLDINLDGSGGDVDLYLYAPGATDIYVDSPAAYSAVDGNKESISGTVKTTGYWYIDVYSYAGTTNYNFTATISPSSSSQAGEFVNQSSGDHTRRK